MEKKRKLPARGARESASKRRAPSGTPEERKQTPTPTPTVPSPVVEESLPKSIAPGKPLPTLDAPQPENLPTKEFQTVSESGVLVESLERSRKKWLSEGIFEKYWTKPVKKKGAPDAPPNNPPKDSMTKLGSCTIYIEPHQFEATMYAIKEPAARPTYTAPNSQSSMYRPIVQYGPPNGIMPPPAPPAPPPAQTTSQQSARPQQAPVKIPQSLTSNIPNPAARSQSNGIQTSANGPTTSNPSNPNPQTTTNNPAPAEPADKSKDPVIQMLAERASTDPDLKALMRIVANGQATPEELRRFQSHIDDLTRLQKARQTASQPSQPTNHPPPPPVANPQFNGHSQTRPTPHNPTPYAAGPAASRPAPPNHVSATVYQNQPQALRSKGPVPSTKPDISGVVFEFHGGNGDRYLFPKFSILEYLPNGYVIASFLIVRKGSSSDSPSYDPKLDYYQPITIRLWASQSRQLEALQKVIAPPDEVRRYMDDIMDNMTRAEYVLLAMRLPKDTEPAISEKEAASEKPDTVNNQVLWATTNPTPAPVVKPAKRLLTEEEKYQGFINSVAAVES